MNWDGFVDIQLQLVLFYLLHLPLVASSQMKFEIVAKYRSPPWFGDSQIGPTNENIAPISRQSIALILELIGLEELSVCLSFPPDWISDLDEI